MKWKKLKPHKKPYIGCLICGGEEMIEENGIIRADMKTRLYSSMGGWEITKNKKVFYSENPDQENGFLLSDIENIAKEDNNNDWRAILITPLRGATYQRQENNLWILVKSDKGFA